jgi:hypothetical protein
MMPQANQLGAAQLPNRRCVEDAYDHLIDAITGPNDASIVDDGSAQLAADACLAARASRALARAARRLACVSGLAGLRGAEVFLVLVAATEAELRRRRRAEAPVGAKARSTLRAIARRPRCSALAVGPDDLASARASFLLS